MAQKVKAVDVNGTNQVLNVSNLATTEIKDVGVNQLHSVTIINTEGVSTTYYFEGGRPKR